MLVIYNPVAGLRRRRVLWRVLDILSANGVRVDLAETSRAGDAERIARDAVKSGKRLIVAAGGDGTIAEAASGINGSGAALGVIPLGTANVFARELALPFAARPIAASLAFGRTRAIWPGLARGRGTERLFVQMIGVGLDAQVVHAMPRWFKRGFGRTAYGLVTAKEMLTWDYAPIRVRIDGAETEAGSVVVSKGRFYAGRYLLAPGADPSDRGFSVALFGRRGPGAVLMYGAALLAGRLPAAPGMRLARAHEVEIVSEATPVQADGDPAGAAPLTIGDAGVPLQIVVS